MKSGFTADAKAYSIQAWQSCLADHLQSAPVHPQKVRACLRRIPASEHYPAPDLNRRFLAEDAESLPAIQAFGNFCGVSVHVLSLHAATEKLGDGFRARIMAGQPEIFAFSATQTTLGGDLLVSRGARGVGHRLRVEVGA